MFSRSVEALPGFPGGRRGRWRECAGGAGKVAGAGAGEAMNRTEAPGLSPSQVVGDLERCLFGVGAPGGGGGSDGRFRLPQGGGSPVGKEGLPSLRAESWAPSYASITGILPAGRVYGEERRRSEGRSWT